jgi:hypothetical protein
MRSHEILKRLNQGIDRVDYRQLRFEIAADPSYDPEEDQDFLMEMNLAEDPAKADEMLTQLLFIRFLSPVYQRLAIQREMKSGNHHGVLFHTTLRHLILDSVAASGDGRSSETAFDVIHADEEYELLRDFELVVDRQSLVQRDGHMYDVMECHGIRARRSSSISSSIASTTAGAPRATRGRRSSRLRKSGRKGRRQKADQSSGLCFPASDPRRVSRILVPPLLAVLPFESSKQANN